MNSNLDPTYIELESKIQILEIENETLSAKAEENLLLNRAFEEIDVYDDIDKLFLSTLESISVLLNIQFSGLFDIVDNQFICKSSYALFSNEETVNIQLKVQEPILKRLILNETCFFSKPDSGFTFNYPDSDFKAEQVLLIPLHSEFIKNRYFVFINDSSQQDLAERKPLFEKIIRIISTKLERIYFQNELKILNEELEKKFAIRTVELQNRNIELEMAILRAEQSELQAKDILQTAMDGFWLVDMQGRFIEINEIACTMLGYSREEMLDMRVPDITFDESAEQAKARIEEILKNGGAQFESKQRCKDGKIIDVELSVKVQTSQNLLVVFVSDFTERKQAEEALQQSEEKFRTFFNESPIGIELYDAEGFQTDANKASLTMFGITDIAELKTFNLFDGTSLSSESKEILHRGESVSYQSAFDFDRIKELKQYKSSRSGKSHFDYLITPLWNSDRKLLLGYLLQIQDISDRKRAEQIQNVIYHIANAVITTENLHQLMSLIQKELGTIIDTSNFYLALFDQQTDTISLPYFVDEYDDFKILPAEKTITRYVIQTQKSLLADVNTICQLENEGVIGRYGADSLIWLGVPLKIEGNVTGVLAVQSYTDVKAYNESDKLMLEFISDQISLAIDRKKTEENLITTKEHAEESDRLKSAFLANMSHEIRTPMNGILGFAELLKEPELSGEQQQEYIRIIEKSGVRMLNIINDIVDISKIESGLMNVSLSESNVNEQLEYLFMFFQTETKQKGIQLILKNNLPVKEAILVTDREKLYAILTNLIKNAIKYTDAGTIEFGCEIVESHDFVETHGIVETHGRASLQNGSPQSSFLQFYVKDTGIGIPKHRQEAIFERFIQADINDKMARQGAGLGLAISRAYVEMLGGKIWVESEEAQGSAFYFTLPFQTKNMELIMTENLNALQSDDQQARKLKILIVEDDESSNKLICVSVQKFAKEVISVTSGNEAVQVCRANSDIDLILMDIQMPGMDGYEATRLIREFNPKVVIIAQTAYALSGDREKSLDAGCNDYISKPIKRTLLMELIDKYFGK